MGSNQKIKNIFFKVNFNNDLGLGNLMRCIRIAKEFPNIKKIFVIQSILNKKIKRHLPKKSKIIVSNDKNISLEKAAEKFLLIRELCSQSILIVDDNRINKIWHKTIINHVKKLIVIDDLALNQNFCDLYINYKFTTKFNHLSKIKKLNKKKTRIYLGKEFIIIDKNLKKRESNNKYPRKILINFGNSFDFYRAKNLVKEIIAITPKITNILVCVGILAKNYKYIINLKKKHRNLKIVYKKIFIEKILNNIDIYIGSCGSSLYENGYLNIPSIFFSISFDQINKIQDVKKIGHNFLYKKERINSRIVIDTYKNLYKNFPIIKNKNLNTKVIVNNKGLSKIKKLILAK